MFIIRNDDLMKTTMFSWWRHEGASLLTRFDLWSIRSLHNLYTSWHRSVRRTMTNITMLMILFVGIMSRGLAILLSIRMTWCWQSMNLVMITSSLFKSALNFLSQLKGRVRGPAGHGEGGGEIGALPDRQRWDTAMICFYVCTVRYMT